MEDDISVNELRVLLRREHRRFLRYLENNHDEVVDHIKTLCGLGPDDAERAYRQYLDDAVDDSLPPRKHHYVVRGTRVMQPRNFIGDPIGI